MNSVVVNAGVLWMVAACGPVRDAGWNGVVRDSAGVTIVENTEQALWDADENWIAEPALTIGAGHGDDEADYEFGNVRGVVVLVDGRIAVLDALASRVRIFTADGGAAGAFGSSGRGPGELTEYADALWSEPGDTLVVVDMGSRSISRFLADGTFVRALQMPFEGGFTYYWKGDAAGLAYHNARQFAGRSADTLESIEVRDAAGRLVHTVARYGAREAMAADRSGVRLTLFAPEIQWTPAPGGGVWVGETHAYQLKRYGLNGQIVRVVTKPFSPRPVSDADRVFYVDAMVRLWQNRVSPAMRPQLRDVTSFHETMPVFVDVRTGPVGTLWVQPFRGVAMMPAGERDTFDPERDLGGTEWDVFDTDGRFLGAVGLPLRFTPYVFRGASLFGVSRDADDVQRIVRLDLRRADGGPIPRS
ncbi:MAG: 6-bladed beta-propeller [Gemmatimonadetes bacterium]|nr:6-bladed beta-propeller [Gemmatimonadota bacterium]